MVVKVDCYICGREIIGQNKIGLNKKFLGRGIKRFHCLQCLADYLGLSVEELEERIEEFKDSGCALFE